MNANRVASELAQRILVRMEGLEPTRLAAPDPKSGTSTNFATSAETKSKRKGLISFP